MKPRMLRYCLLPMLIFCSLAPAMAAEDIAAHRYCGNCGMDRKSYGFSRVLIRYRGGVEVGSCSLNCAVIDMEERKGQQVQTLLVADRGTRTLIDAKAAYWVMGGEKRGVMTERPKWAFAGRNAAETFVKGYGGAVVIWETVLHAAQEDALAHRFVH